MSLVVLEPTLSYQSSGDIKPLEEVSNTENPIPKQDVIQLMELFPEKDEEVSQIEGNIQNELSLNEQATPLVIPLTSLGSPIPDEEETEEDYSEEKKAIMWELLREKRKQLQEKVIQINLLHQQIADLDKPAAQDIAILRRKIDSCFRQVWSLQQSKEEAEAAITKSRAVQEQLQGQRNALNEKKKVAIFEFESNHLQRLKEIEEEIRALSG